MSETGRHKACTSCRERKIKCDGGQPRCRRCARSNAQCFYASPSKRFSKSDVASKLENLQARVQQMEQEKLANALHGARTIAPATSRPVYPTWLPPTSYGSESFATPDFAHSLCLYPGLREHSLPTPGPPATLDPPSSEMVMFCSDSGSDGRHESPNGQVLNPDSSTATKENPIIPVHTDDSSVDPGMAHNSDFSEILDDQFGLSLEWRSNDTTHAPSKHDSEFSRLASNAHSPRSRKNSQSGTPQRFSVRRSSSAYGTSSNYGTTALSNTLDNFELENSTAPSYPMTQKRRRLHIGGGGLQGFGYAAGNYNTGYFDISLESNNISTTSQQHRASLSITQSNQDLPSNANASFTTYSRQHSISNEGLLSPMSFKSLSPCTSSMRRNIGNGMAFNGIVKLRGKENYQEWYRAVRAAARKEGVWDMLTGDCSRPHPPGPGASLAEQQEYHDNIVYWNSKSELALGGIEGSLEKSAQASVDNIECPRAMWLKLERDYNPLGTKVLYDLMQKLDTLNLSGDVEKLADDLRELKKRIDTQREADALPHWYYTIRFLRSLAPAYEEFVSSMMDRDAASGDDKHRFTELTFEQVVSKAMAEEQRRKHE